MKAFLAKNKLGNKAQTITIEQIKKDMQGVIDKIFYLDSSNANKDVLALINELKKDFSVNFSEVRYRSGDEDYIYQLHLIN